MTVFVDSDHTGDFYSSFANWSTDVSEQITNPVEQYSKKQASIEPSTFGSEFSSSKVATDLIKGMRYKRRMMGVPLDGPAHVRVYNNVCGE